MSADREQERLTLIVSRTGQIPTFPTARFPANVRRNTIAAEPKLPYAEEVNARTWKAWLVPGGLLLALTAMLVNSSLFSEVASSLAFYYVAVFVAGLFLAWRFNSAACCSRC